MCIRDRPYKACTPLTNAADVRGRIVVVLRGECYFVTKAEHAQNAGAVAVLVVNNIPNQWVIMAPPSGYNISRIQIPVLKVLRRANATIQALPTGSSATLVGDCSAHCPASWIGDDICDEHCRTDVCAHDNGDCAPDSFECNFDRGMCGWENVGTGQETADSKDYWRLDVGMTSTHSTGPLADHTKGPCVALSFRSVELASSDVWPRSPAALKEAVELRGRPRCSKRVAFWKNFLESNYLSLIHI